MKNGCMTSGVASPSCLIVSRSICRSLGIYTLAAAKAGDGPTSGEVEVPAAGDLVEVASVWLRGNATVPACPKPVGPKESFDVVADRGG